jgi:hypothetical protein
MRKYLLFLAVTLISHNLQAKEFESKFNFNFELNDNYQIINNFNLYEVYDSSHNDPKIKQQINIFKQRLKEQDVEILVNFKQSILDNISILVFDDNYEINEDKVFKQCKKNFKIEKNLGKRKVILSSVEGMNIPKFAKWSRYRENESFFF